MEKCKQFISDLFGSIFKTKDLFKFAIYNFVTPLVILFFICGIMVIPTLTAYNSLKIENITSNVLYIDKAMAYTLDQDIKCSINDNKFTCDEGYSYETLYEFKNNNNDTIKYTIYVNSDVTTTSFKTGEFGQHYDTDNYLIFFETSFVYRYTYHNPKTESVDAVQFYGFYDNLNGFNLSQINTEADAKEDKESYLLSTAQSFMLDGYKAVAKQAMITSFVADIGLYIVLIAIVALLIKGNYMLKRNKGFKYTQAFKIGIVSSLQSVIISLVLSLFGFSFINMFGLAITIRIIYIYIRYTGSKKNTTWLDELYEYTKDERFNI